MTDRADMRAALLAELKRPRTSVGAASLLAGAAIVANALFLQGPHPSPLVSTRGSVVDEVQAGDPQVRSVQDALAQAGYYSGPLDGINGPDTRSAILAFEAKAGRASTGKASAELLAEIRASIAKSMAAPAQSTGSVDAGANAAPDERVAAVQRALSLSAYGPLRTDGVFGPETRDAIMRFQRDHDLPVTGAVSDALLIELRAAGALRDG